MPKKFSMADKEKWLDDYEGGKSEVHIAKKNKCDARTVKKGIEEARRKHDARIARAELLKDALLKHQQSLLDRLKEILSTLTTPPEDWVPLPWYGDGDSILGEDDPTVARAQSREVDRTTTGAEHQADIVQAMLKEHLRNDKLWKILAQREKAYTSHQLGRIALQIRVGGLLQEESGYKMVDRSEPSAPFLYSYTTGDLFFKMTLRRAFEDHCTDDWKGDIVADTAAGCVKYQNQILAEVPGEEKECSRKLLDAFGKMQSLPEVIGVVDTFGELRKATIRARQVVEEVLLLGLVPGQCKICRRLGM